MVTGQKILKLERLIEERPELLARLPPKKRLLAESLLERRRAARRIPIALFRPHAKQQAVIASTRRVRILAGGNRSGKTHVGAALAIANVLGYRPWEVPDFCLIARSDGRFDCPPRERVPESAWVRLSNGAPIPVPNVGVIVSGQGLRVGISTVIAPKLASLLSTAIERRVVLTAGRTPVRMEFPNGSVIHFASPDQSRMAFEGWSAAWAWVDEPIPSYLIGAIWRGLVDLGGSLLFTLTPLGADARWIFTEFGQNRREDTDVFYMSTEDNPHLDREALATFDSLETWSDAERAARLFGQLECAVDTVFPAFRADLHVIEPRELDEGATRVLSVDPHSRRPWYCLWAEVRDGVWTVYRELPRSKFFRVRETSLSLHDWVRAIQDAEDEDGVTVDLRVIDPRAAAYPQQTGKKLSSLLDLLLEEGLRFVRARAEPIEDGLHAITELLTASPPRLRIFSTCPHLIAALRGLTFRPARDDDDRALTERLSELYKDPVDALRYAVRFPIAPKLASYSYLNEEDSTLSEGI